MKIGDRILETISTNLIRIGSVDEGVEGWIKCHAAHGCCGNIGYSELPAEWIVIVLQYMNCDRFVSVDGDGIITMKSTTTIPIMATVTRQAGA